MLFQLLLVEPAGAIDTAEHRVVLVTAPIGAGHAGQLEGIGIELAGAGQVRAAAHVEPVVARPVNGQGLIVRQFRRPFRLEAFALLLPPADQLLAAPLLAAQRLVGGDDLAHFGFDRGQVLIGEGPVLGREVIVEAIVGRRTEGDLRAGKQRLDRFGQNVGEIVPRQFQRLGLVPRRDQRELGIRGEGSGQVNQFAIDTRRQGRLGQAGADCRRHVGRSRASGHFAHGTIGQADLQEFGHSYNSHRFRRALAQAGAHRKGQRLWSGFREETPATRTRVAARFA